MFDRILVPVDGTSRGIAAVEVARHLAERVAAELELLRVEGALASLGQVLADNRALEEQASDLRRHGGRVHHAIAFGWPRQGHCGRGHGRIDTTHRQCGLERTLMCEASGSSAGVLPFSLRRNTMTRQVRGASSIGRATALWLYSDGAS